MMRKPKANPDEALWLEVAEAALLLERMPHQTLDHGAPVSPRTVARELRHSSRSMIDQPCSHPGRGRHRAEVVEYRIDQQRDNLGSRPDSIERRPHRPERLRGCYGKHRPARRRPQSVKLL